MFNLGAVVDGLIKMKIQENPHKSNRIPIFSQPQSSAAFI